MSTFLFLNRFQTFCKVVWLRSRIVFQGELCLQGKLIGIQNVKTSFVSVWDLLVCYCFRPGLCLCCLGSFRPVRMTRNNPSGSHDKGCSNSLNLKGRCFNASFLTSFSIGYTSPSLTKGKEVVASHPQFIAAGKSKWLTIQVFLENTDHGVNNCCQFQCWNELVCF